MGDKELPLRVGTCSLTEFNKKEAAGQVLGGWEAKRLAEADFLKGGIQRDWGLEDIVMEGDKVRCQLRGVRRLYS